MADKKVQIGVGSSILEKDGKFAVLIHWINGPPILQSDFQFNTIDEAKAAGSKILDLGMAAMKERGYNTRRPGQRERGHS